MAEPLLQVRGLSKIFPVGHGRLLTAVNDISLEIGRGEALALVGESGSGKTTLGRCVLALIEPTSGSILFRGDDIFSLPRPRMRDFRRRVQMVFQEPYASLSPRMTIGRIVEEPLRLCPELTSAQRLVRVRAALAMVRLEASASVKYPHQFSAGEQQRIAIARAIVTQPQLVVLDEPTSALDVSVRAEILDLLAELRQRLHLSYMFISHDLAALRRVCDRVAVMYLGKIVEAGATETMFARPLHPYTRALLSSVLYPDPKVTLPRFVLSGEIPSPIDLPSGCHLHQRCPWASTDCSRRYPALEQLAPERWVACFRAREINADEALPAG
jgi:oligopeptide/dipeptide ABC transporter ATP-binding protein